jgi:transcription elongation GreA/GreB family factor
VTKNVVAREELRHRATHSVLSKIIDALDSDEFRDLKAHLREHFEPGGIAFLVFDASDRDAVDHLLNLVDSAAALEDHRKTEIRRAIFRKYPDIRKRTDDDVLYVTVESAEAKRAEFEQLVKVEIPENAEAIRLAREYGDLRENFEYHAARQKHELLNSRAAQLHADLQKARLIDPAAVDGGRVGIGTSFELESLSGEPTRPVTILGHWDSDPDNGVYSYQSEFAKRLLGKELGDVVETDAGSYRITGLRPWRTAEEVSSAVGAERDASGD